MTPPAGSSFTRRGLIASATVGASVTALGGVQALAETSARKTFVLVHGAWHGVGAGGACPTCWRSGATKCSRRP